ncbi:hypothetical protein PR048_016202 [Dryococelus australis]|uniref:Uncharacterized protein n=1 Tax=Dryococelus australis TaxID=614101 RepID=A0ABQ9HJ84_9NEOP|nr:hypothetical protein PR048_016202 [Dryococelus australis]
MEKRRNARVGEVEEPRENPSTSGIDRLDSHLRKYGGEPTGNRTRLAKVGGGEVLKADEGYGWSGVGMRLAGEAGDPREDPPTNGIVKHDSHLRKSARFALVGGDPANCSAAVAPIKKLRRENTTDDPCDFVRKIFRTAAPLLGSLATELLRTAAPLLGSLPTEFKRRDKWLIGLRLIYLTDISLVYGGHGRSSGTSSTLELWHSFEVRRIGDGMKTRSYVWIQNHHSSTLRSQDIPLGICSPSLENSASIRGPAPSSPTCVANTQGHVRFVVICPIERDHVSNSIPTRRQAVAAEGARAVDGQKAVTKSGAREMNQGTPVMETEVPQREYHESRARDRDRPWSN